jgi:hypothetical protein
MMLLMATALPFIAKKAQAAEKKSRNFGLLRTLNGFS